MTQIIVDEALSECWSLTEQWIDDIKAKIHRSSCRIGTTIEKKNDKKRVEEAGDLLTILESLAMLFFDISGELELARSKHS